MKQKFIKFGGRRIKSNSIKDYGIGYATHEVKRPPTQTEINIELKEAEDRKEKRKKWDILGKLIDEFDIAYTSSNYYKIGDTHLTTMEECYLYVITYQDGTYLFYENRASFNIRDKMKELDKHLT